MKIGDLVEVNTGQRGIIVGVERMYPNHSMSPPRNFDILWSDEPPRFAFLTSKETSISKVSAFSVTKVISKAR
jgi:hypothetical protein